MAGRRPARILWAMAAPTRYTRHRAGRPEEEGEERRPSRRPGQSGLPIVPIAALVVMVGAAIWFARLIADNTAEPAAAAPAEPAYVPFADVPLEEPPTPGERASDGGLYARAPNDLAASNPDWARALALASTADGYFAEAQKAKADGDYALFNEKGKLAKETYDEAFTLTAAWEEDLFEKYGERDRQVRQIVRTRTRWIDRVRVLHKTTSR